MEEQIDVLLATYNGEKYVGEQIESILNQTYKNIRLVISDDCSSDNTVNILKEYEKKDNRIKLYIQSQNLGVVKNIEFLLENVENELYMLSDQDDVWKKEKVEKTIAKLKEENLDLVFGDLEIVDENLNTNFLKMQSFYDFSWWFCPNSLKQSSFSPVCLRKMTKNVNNDRIEFGENVC